MAVKSSQPRASASVRSDNPIVRTLGWAWVRPSPAITCECAIRSSLRRCSKRPRDDVGTPLAGHAERDLLAGEYSAARNRRLSRFFDGGLKLQIGAFGVLADIGAH